MTQVFICLYDMNDRVNGSLDYLVDFVRTCGLSEDIPLKFYHPIIHIHGYSYDYNKTGINKRPNIENGFDKQISVIHKAIKKDPSQLSTWLHSRSMTYRAKNYDMVHNNCIKFVEDMCEFLEVPTPPVLLHIQQWLYQNRKSILLKLVGKVSGYSDDFRRSLHKKKPR